MRILTTTIARWIFALAVGILGVNHFLNPSDLVITVPDFIPRGIVLGLLHGIWIFGSLYQHVDRSVGFSLIRNQDKFGKGKPVLMNERDNGWIMCHG